MMKLDHVELKYWMNERARNLLVYHWIIASTHIQFRCSKKNYEAKLRKVKLAVQAESLQVHFKAYTHLACKQLLVGIKILKKYFPPAVSSVQYLVMPWEPEE